MLALTRYAGAAPLRCRRATREAAQPPRVAQTPSEHTPKES